ncbi:esterase-like activity of phytase family protein [Hyphomonas johnsonii]|uniref:Phytase-like domain-containing protein n=1 Tax=Hyphomonas johnsonii MHS-2 TaxID=1280950 RepID=A0A059FVN9_9PROT|nr:esterase-like activity of phytase family protein [Hyphomonas johnsonii]KCZ94536.1 hypothetical protein HJO_04140 [Hyphomonas johnsonii MHS-2]
MRTPVRTSLVLCASLLALAVCAAPKNPLPEDPVSAERAQWSFETAADRLGDLSCPADQAGLEPIDIHITAEPVSLDARSDHDNVLPAGATFAGGWHLTSDNAGFGGLSGIDSWSDNALLAVSDTGMFVWIGMANGQPDGTGELAYMLDQNGAQLSGKADGDAEGLAVKNGVALVSFERNHRIEAFYLARCSAAARSTEVATLPSSVNGRDIDENQGAEALSISPSGLLHYGLESFRGSASPLGVVLDTGYGWLTGELAGNPSGYSLVGLDEVQLPSGKAMTVTLFRSYDPIRGSRNIVTWAADGPAIELKRPLLVDNFEGVAGELTAPDTLRIWLISDNNFSDRQRTLLYAFDVALPTE